MMSGPLACGLLVATIVLCVLVIRFKDKVDEGAQKVRDWLDEERPPQ